MSRRVRWILATSLLGAALLASCSGGDAEPARTVLQLLADLEGVDADKRGQAAKQLAAIHDDPAVMKPVTALLFDPKLGALVDPWFRSVGANAIGASPWVSEIARGKTPKALGLKGEPKVTPQMRLRAVAILTIIGGPRAYNTLSELLGDPSAAVQEAASRALERIGTAAIPEAVRSLADRDSFLSAVALLANLNPWPEEAILAAGLETPSVVARQRLIEHVLKSRFQLAVTLFLLEELTHPHWAVRDAALQALFSPNRTLDEAGLARVRALLDDPDIEVRGEAARQLGKRVDKASESKLLKWYRWRPKSTPGLRPHELPTFHDAVARALIQIGSEAGLVEVLTRYEADPEHGNERALGLSKDRRCLAPLLGGLAEVKSDWARESHLEALGELGFSEARTGIEARLEHKTMRVRWAAVRALKTLADPAAAPALEARLKDPSGQVVDAALESLKELAGPSSIAAVCAFLADPKRRHEQAAIDVLRKIASPDVTPCLLETLTQLEESYAPHPPPPLWSTVVQVLGDLGDARAVEPLLRRVQAPEKRPPAPPGQTMRPEVSPGSVVVDALRLIAGRHAAEAKRIGAELARRGH